MKKLIAWLLVLLLCVSVGMTAYAATPYRTYSLGSGMREVETQTAYEPIRSMTRFEGKTEGDITYLDVTLKNPADIRLGPDGNLYIADDGNERIVVITPSGEFVKYIGTVRMEDLDPTETKQKKIDSHKEDVASGESSGVLRSASGVYVDAALNVYVADTKSNKVFVFSPEGELLYEYGKPTHPIYGAPPFKPSKIVLDKRGNLYIASEGNTNGIVQISPLEGEGTEEKPVLTSPADGGEFLGYYGANSSTVNILTRIKRTLFKGNDLITGDIKTPSVSNLCIDGKGMVYTVTAMGDATSLRRLNVAGKNTMTPEYITAGNSAVAVNSSGSIFTVNQDGIITEYTAEGDMLFTFGGKDTGDQRIGTFKDVSGLVVMDDYTIYVLDRSLGSVQVLQPTEFADLVHQAFTLFQDGKYAESKGPWEQVLRMNSMFNYASTGLGESLYREGNFSEAMDRYRNGGERQGYSDSWWEERSNWLHTHMSTIIAVAVGAIVLWQIIKLLDRRFRILNPLRTVGGWIAGVPIIGQVLYCFQMLRNPYDTCYGIKKEKRAGYISALVVLFIFFALYVANKYFAGFLFKMTPDGYYELLNDFLLVFGVFLLLVICCYLVCTITDGESKFRDLFIGCAYALAPMLIFMPVKLLLTNVLTYNEEFFITLIDVVSIGWSALLVILVIMYQNDYTLKKTFVTILLTVFTVLVVVALAVVMYMLVSQLVDFVTSIYGEVVYRFVKKV